MITKRIFLTALGCDTAGWYATRTPADPPGHGVEWRFHVGTEIGRLARRQLGDGVTLPSGQHEIARSATARALADPDAKLLFEATFMAAEFVARADALRRDGDGWDLIEVKSALEPEGDKVKDEHLDDLAYTVFVAIASGMPVRRCTLMFLDRNSRRGAERLGELNVTERVLQRAAEFSARAPGVVAACLAADRPEPVLQFICRKCEFFATDCVGKGVPDPLFLLPRLSEKRFEELRPFQRLSAVPPDVTLTPPQRRVFDAVRSGTPSVDGSVLAGLDDLVWPVYYLDFEAVAPPLPWFDGCEPYEVLPFQYSIHICDRPGHETAHNDYLAPIGGDWREDLAAALVGHLGDHGSIVVYTDYELKRLTAMAQAFPRFEAALQAIIARLVDLEPLVRKGYCHPDFLGRSSIKNVLPVVAPELSYQELDIGNGLDAEGLFALMTVGRRDPNDHATHRRHLLEYCRLDTLAMVKVHGALDELNRGS